MAKYGPKEWHKIQALVPTRTDMQCRERYHNLSHNDHTHIWTDEANASLQRFVQQHGRAWAEASKVVGRMTFIGVIVCRK